MLLKGKPIEAESCYRTALGLGAKVPESERVRLMVCLGDALLDQKRYEEAKQYLTQALELGDSTGSGQGSMCDLLLAQGDAPETALAMADDAMRLYAGVNHSAAFGVRWNALSKELHEAKSWARKAQAFLMLDRRIDARQAIDRALRILEASKPELERVSPSSSLLGRLVLGHRLQRMKRLTISVTNWRIGLSLLAMGYTQKATEHFLIVRDTDRMGKYRRPAQEQLDSLGYIDTNSP